MEYFIHCDEGDEISITPSTEYEEYVSLMVNGDEVLLTYIEAREIAAKLIEACDP